MSTPPGPQPPPNPYGYPPPVYHQPVYVVPQAEPYEPAEKRVTGSQAIRAVLILAAVAGVLTAAIGLIFMLSSPDEYGIGTRTKLQIDSQVGRGGTGQPLTQAAATAPPPLAPLPAAPPLQPSTPKRLIIPKIGVNAPIKGVGLDKNKQIEPPPASNANLVGWYRGFPTPGQAGVAVMLGHKDTLTRSAVFTRLHELQYGDTIEVVRMDGTVAVFTVGGIEQANKQTFPTTRVYGPQHDAELRLITCGGTYNRTTGHYLDNVIVYATMTSTHKAP